MTLRTGSCLMEAVAIASAVGYAAVNDTKMNECKNERFYP